MSVREKVAECLSGQWLTPGGGIAAPVERQAYLIIADALDELLKQPEKKSVIDTTKIECTCSDEFRKSHFSHDQNCPLEKALDSAYCQGWREGQANPDWKEPEKLARVWAS